MTTISLTKYTAQRPARLSKRFLLRNAELIKESGGKLIDGFADRVTVSGLSEFADLLKGLSPKQALSFGVSGHDRARVVPRAAVASIHDELPVIARDHEHIHWPDGAGIFMGDYDVPDGEEPLGREQMLDLLYTHWPALRQGPHLWRPSASSCIINGETGELLRDVCGQRVYVVVRDACDLPRAGQVLIDRLWLAGHGWIKISASGSLLLRSPVDAMFQPERLDFAGGAECVPPLVQRLPEPYLLNPDAEPIDTSATLTDLTEAERAEVARLQAEAKAAKVEEAAEVRARWMEEKFGELVKRNPGISEERLRAVLQQAVEGQVLFGAFILYDKGGRPVTVREMLADAAKWNGKYVRDPLEPGYSPSAAWICIDEKAAFLYSHAHGLGTRYTLFDERMFPNEPAEPQAEDGGDADASGGETGAGDDPAAGVGPHLPQARHLCTDQANADRLLKAAGTKVMFAAGRWYFWKGTHWSPDEAAAYRCACELSALVLAEADEWERRPAVTEDEAKKNRGIAKALRGWAKYSEMKTRIDAAFSILRRLVAKPADLLDVDAYLLNVANGTIDLRTGELRLHDPANLITKLIPIKYKPDATAPLFERTLAEITGEADFVQKPMAAFLQRWFGYCATGLVSEQAFVVHYGDGANGKSLLLEAIGRVLGPYAGAAAPSLLVGGAQDRHPTELADLFGRRMVTSSESGEDGAMREDFIKKVTGGDKIKARFLRQDFFEFSPTHKLQLVTNHKPQVRGQDYGIWRRVLLVPYNVCFGTPEAVTRGEAHHVRDEALGERLKGEDEGILAWIVQGALSWQAMGLKAPDAVVAAGASYREEQDRVGQFLTECCEAAPAAWTALTGPGGLYPAYKDWCRENGYHPLGRTRFQAAAEKRPGLQKEERHRGKTRTKAVGYRGLRLLFVGGFSR